MDRQNERTGKAQVIKCTHGVIFAACLAPEYYVDDDWLKDVAEYKKAGCTTEIVTSAEVREMFDAGPCKCNKATGHLEEPAPKPIKIHNQLELEF